MRRQIPGFPERTAINFTVPPDHLGPAQRGWLIALSVFAAISRIFALSRSPWDGDESLFELGMRAYDVALHHPHPPGFPLFIAAGRLVRLITGSSDFHALQSVSLLASFALFPLVFLLMWEIRLPFGVAITAALLTTFFPTIWFFGGTAFSDVPSLVLVLAGSLFLLRGVRSGRDYLIGTTLLAVAIGFRTQNLIVGLIPGLIATWYRWRDRARQVVIAAAIGIAIVGGSYGAAASITGWSRYRDALKVHEQYIKAIDSYTSPIRPPLMTVANDFFVTCYGAGARGDNILRVLVMAGAVLFLLQSPGAAGVMFGMFGPLAVMAWLYLDYHSGRRFAIGYDPLLAVCIAFALEPLAALSRRIARPLGWLPVGVILAGLFRAALPGLVQARSTVSPPAAMTSWVVHHLDPASTDLYVPLGLAPFAAEDLDRYRVHLIHDPSTVPLLDLEHSKGAYLLQEALSGRKGVDFVRARDPLWFMARWRFFEMSIVPLSAEMHFQEGWYPGENVGTAVWHWMGRHSTTELPPGNGITPLVLALQFPLDTLPSTPNVTIRMNGSVIDQFKGDRQSMVRRYLVTPMRSGTNRLEIETDQIVNPAARHLSPDTRDLGLVLTSLSWGGRAGN